MINNMEQVQASLNRLITWVETEKFMGWDPYDILNSRVPFHWLGKWGPPIATQVQKRNPVNLRPVLGIEKGYNPKGMGLSLKAYCNLYHLTGVKKHLATAHSLFEWLADNYSPGYSGYCWGYNFPWASPKEYKKAYLPSVVVTSVVIDGMHEYHKITGSCKAKNIIFSAAEYILQDIPVTHWDDGLSFAYTHISKGVCYNASLHATEVLVRAKSMGANIDEKLITEAVHYALNRQKPDGSWNYSYDPVKDTERKQIDFHQGFVLVSLRNIMKQGGILQDEISRAITKGLEFYKKEQFFPNGRSMWRLPKKWPVDIHNQSQGIITFALLKDYGPAYLDFADTIVRWTIDNMQGKQGSFYYRKYPLFTNKIPYMRWGQAWMLLALTEYLLMRQGGPKE